MAEPSHTVLVTGASAGIGEACARELAGRGHRVALAARSIDKTEDIAAQLRADGSTAIAVKIDVVDADAVGKACSAVRDQLGPITALVNNAGVVEPLASLADADPKLFASCIETNLIGAWHVIAAVIPAMAEAGAGIIVNVSSGAAERPLDSCGAYCASKAGLAMLTRVINHEYGAQGIAAYGFRPGQVATGMQNTIRTSGIDLPTGLVPESELIKPDYVGRAIAWLVENKPAEWTGVVEVDIRDPDFVARAGL